MGFLVTGCEHKRDSSLGTRGDDVGRTYQIVCIDNVQYLRDSMTNQGYYITARLKTDGKPYLCDLEPANNEKDLDSK